MNSDDSTSQPASESEAPWRSHDHSTAFAKCTQAAVKVDTKCTAAAVEHSTMTVLPYHDRRLRVY